MEKKISKMDVFVSRGIWYIMTLPSIFGLSTSLNLLWPHGDSSSQSLRDGAVSVTTFYAVTLLRNLFFTDAPSTCYREFTTNLERLPQVLFSIISSFSVFLLLALYEPLANKDFELSISLFTISLFTGGLGLIQLSDTFRMEIGHAFFTLFLGCLFCFTGTTEVVYKGDYHDLLCFLFLLTQMLLPFGLVICNLYLEEDSDTSSASRLPT